MTSTPLAPPRRWAAAVTAVLLTVVVTCAALALLMRWDRVRWEVPFEYEGDVLLMQMIVQTGLEQPWYLQSPRLGAPHGMEMYDYPCADTLDIVLIESIGLFERRPSVVFNLFYVLTYPLAALAMLGAARWLGMGWPAAAAAGILFAFLPYHALRGERHLFLSTYFPVPLMAAVLVEIAMGRLAFFPAGKDGRVRFRLTDGRTLRSAAVAVILGMANPYYGFFALLLLPVAGLIDLLTRRRVWGVLSTFVIGGLLAGSMTVNTLPSLIYQMTRGANPKAFLRSREEAEHYGLKFTHLILPAPNHRSEWVQTAREFYRSESRPMENENTYGALGTVGAVGFLGLLVVILVPRPNRPPRTTALAQLNAAALLIGTLGGIGVLVNMAFTQFRCYNRISIFIGAFALLAVGGCIDAVLNCCRRPGWIAAALLALAALVAFGVWDGATRRIEPDSAAMGKRWDADASFVRMVEERLPPGSRVFQLPAVNFPESPQVNELAYYRSAVGYLHSTKLEWSYGAMHFRPEADWQTKMGERLENAATMDAAIAELKDAGFQSIWVDWLGYEPDQRKALRAEWERRLGPAFASRDDGETDCYRIGMK